MGVPKGRRPGRLGTATPTMHEWRDGEAVPARAADIEVAERYRDVAHKGRPIDGLRLTLLADRSIVTIGEPVRIIHVVEAVSPDARLYVVGPKPIFGESVDGALVTPEPPADVWEPATYNGPVVQGPAVDFDYEVTSYRFDGPGRHRVEWRIGRRTSNVLWIEVEAGPPHPGNPTPPTASCSSTRSSSESW